MRNLDEVQYELFNIICQEPVMIFKGFLGRRISIKL
jgi:hypothetical protein